MSNQIVPANAIRSVETYYQGDSKATGSSLEDEVPLDIKYQIFSGLPFTDLINVFCLNKHFCSLFFPNHKTEEGKKLINEQGYRRFMCRAITHLSFFDAHESVLQPQDQALSSFFSDLSKDDVTTFCKDANKLLSLPALTNLKKSFFNNLFQKAVIQNSQLLEIFNLSKSLLKSSLGSLTLRRVREVGEIFSNRLIPLEGDSEYCKGIKEACEELQLLFNPLDPVHKLNTSSKLTPSSHSQIDQRDPQSLKQQQGILKIQLSLLKKVLSLIEYQQEFLKVQQSLNKSFKECMEFLELFRESKSSRFLELQQKSLEMQKLRKENYLRLRDLIKEDLSIIKWGQRKSKIEQIYQSLTETTKLLKSVKEKGCQSLEWQQGILQMQQLLKEAVELRRLSKEDRETLKQLKESRKLLKQLKESREFLKQTEQQLNDIQESYRNTSITFRRAALVAFSVMVLSFIIFKTLEDSTVFKP